MPLDCSKLFGRIKLFLLNSKNLSNLDSVKEKLGKYEKTLKKMLIKSLN